MHNQKVFYLIGQGISHSLSKQYFDNKFSSLGLENHQYLLKDIDDIDKIRSLIDKEKNLVGFNVTSPFKEDIIPYLDEIDPICQKISAVNCVKIKNNKLIGYNTDYMGFAQSLKQQTNTELIKKALIFGSRGAAKAVAYGLKLLNIESLFVVRNKDNCLTNSILYQDLNNYDSWQEFDLIINATSCGMSKNPCCVPPIYSGFITKKHIVYDLIYSPYPTLLLWISDLNGAKCINGLQMLYNQAELSWQIWNTNE